MKAAHSSPGARGGVALIYFEVYSPELTPKSSSHGAVAETVVQTEVSRKQALRTFTFMDPSSLRKQM